MSDVLLTAIEDGIARMTFNRPQAMNALTGEVVSAMLAFVRRVESDPAAKVLLITGAGDHFMAGGDIGAMQKTLELPEHEIRADFEQQSVNAAPVWQTLHRMPQPVVVKLRGFSAGSALGMIAGADFAVAAESAKFLLAHVGLGLVADGASTYHLPRAVGVRKAKELAYFGDRIGAAEALEIGLLTKVVPEAELDATVEALLARIAGQPARSIAWAKKLMNASLDNSIGDQIALEGVAVGDCGVSADLREGVEAFIAKRKPVFGKG